MLTRRFIITCVFLTVLSFWITPIFAHNAKVLTNNDIGGAFPVRTLTLLDNHDQHGSIEAFASAHKKMRNNGVYASASSQISSEATLDFGDGNVGAPYGHWQVYAEVTGGRKRQEDCGHYSGEVHRGAQDWTPELVDADTLSGIDAEGYGDIYNQISESATCDASI